MTVAVRCEATPEIGTGHVTRCLALAAALRSRGADVTVVTGPVGAALARDAGLSAVAPDGDDDLAAVGTVDAVVVDDYRLDRRWESAARRRTGVVAVLDDLADRPHDCDVLVDTTPPPDPARYARLVPDRAELLLGPRFAQLRGDFVEAARAPRRRDGTVRRILVSFGGTGAFGMTERALDVLDAVAPEPDVEVVVGTLDPRREAIVARCAFRRHTVVHVATRRMATLIAAADLAIGAGGTTAWERCALGLPAIVVTVAENQRAVARGLARSGAAIDAGDATTVPVGALSAAVAALCRDPDRVRAMSDAARTLMGAAPIDGASRVADAVLAAVRRQVA